MFRERNFDDEFFDLLLCITLPSGAKALSYVAFLDESLRPDAGRLLAVAGLVLAFPQAKRLHKEWRRDISGPCNRLTGEDFHMKRLEYLRQKFGGKPIDALEDRAIAIINARITHAVAFIIKRDEFERAMTREWRERYHSLYSMCCHVAMGLVGKWADSVKYRGLVGYHFESGHEDQHGTDGQLRALYKVPELVARYRYGAHVFLDKRTTYGLQAADVFAWNATRWFAESREGGAEMRPSFKKLLGAHPERYHCETVLGDAKVRAWLQQSLDVPFSNKAAERPFQKRMAHLKKRGLV